jgi:hypothetical protein
MQPLSFVEAILKHSREDRFPLALGYRQRPIAACASLGNKVPVTEWSHRIEVVRWSRAVSQPDAQSSSAGI